MKFTAYSLLFFCLLIIPNLIFAQAPGNDECNNAILLTSYANTCTSATSGTVLNATSSGIAVNSCGGTPDDDVWYKFVAQGMNTTISLTNIGSGGSQSLAKADARVEVFYASAGNCSSLTYTTCQAVSNSTSLTLANAALTAGSTYYVRVFSSGAGAPSSNAGFSICVTHTPFPPPPSNDECIGAITLSSGTADNSGTVMSATASNNIPVDCATGNPDDDVWYKITTSIFDTSLTVNLNLTGADWTASNARMQLFKGGCGSLSSIKCGNTTLTASVTGNTTYYIRVYAASTGVLGSTSSGSAFSITATATGITTVTAGRTNEVFQQTTLSGSGALQYPWEITYGPDNKLWITESRGYKVYQMDPATGLKTTVLDLNSTSTDLSAWGADSLRAVNLTSTSNWNSSANNWPQGGLAGLAIHPQFGDGSGHDFVYISYVHRYLATITTPASGGIYFRNKIVRFTYNSGTGKLGAPAVVCDTIPGGQDHNSQRMIIAPVTAGGPYYLFYAAGDMGAGQYGNRMRPENAQNIDSYEGKILRFNLEPDGDGDVTVLNAWIPDTNPYNTLLTKQSAVYSIGIRNNQGFAYDTLTNQLYGASHGPYSDDEINIIESFKNYGHPLIEGFVDGNYNGNNVQGTSTSYSAGAGWNDNSGVSSCPPIGNEDSSRNVINGQGHGLYKDPLFSAYAAPLATVANVWKNNIGGNPTSPIVWPTEAWSGLDIYSNKIVPGWKHSLIAASLKMGRLVKLKLGPTGLTTMPNNNESDTITYFNSKNRFRDLAIAPNGKDLFIIMDNNAATSGPGQANPTVTQCAGCVQKYTFLGYLADANGKSTIPNTVNITAGTLNNCQAGTTITIDATNANLWVPITGDDGNIMAEIKANGNNLGTVTSSFYNSGSVREDANKRLYLNRSLTITPQNQPTSTVNVRFYITSAELSALMGATNSQGAGSGVSGVGSLKVLKNDDANSIALTAATSTIIPAYAEAFGSNGYVLQADITSFSSFYFGNPTFGTLPLQLLTFTGSLQGNTDALLQWTTSNEISTSHFVVERSIDGTNYSGIGSVTANGNTDSKTSYSFTDINAAALPTSVIYYRLKSIDKNGQYSFSKVISIALNKNINVFLFPNPVKQMLNVKLSGRESNPIRIQITDLTGRVIYSEKYVGSQNNFSIDVKQWKVQVYILKVINSKNEVLTTQKFEKM